MQNRALGVAVAISGLLAALLVGGLGAGRAAADPTDPTDPADSGTTGEPPAGEPAPTSTTPTPDLPGALAGVLNDLLHKPFTIFGNGRVPGEPPKPVPTKQRGRGNPVGVPEVKPEPEPIDADPTRSERRQKPSSSVKVVLPFAPPVAVAFPPIPVPGHENLRLTLDLSDPFAALASVQETTNTINSLLADAYAPYDPFKPPAPEPQPTFKILQEEPVVEAGGGHGNRSTPAAESVGDLPVLQAPGMVPPVRIAPPPPVAATAPSGRGSPAPSAGTVGTRGPAPRGAVTQPGSTPDTSAAAMGRPAVRQGYQQYLRSARTGQVATVAVPGLMGLVALTVSGVVTGYRQANSQRYVRADAARFLP